MKIKKKSLLAYLSSGLLLGQLASTAMAMPPLPDPQSRPNVRLVPDEQSRPSVSPVPLPEFNPPQAPQFVLPPLAPPKKDLSSQVKVFVKKFILDGNKAISDEELTKLTKEYEGRTITTGELQELRHKMTLYYINKGYINSGVVIPDQDVKDNIITFKIVEGELTTIKIGDTKRLRKEYVNDRLRLSSGPPLNINELQERIQLLQQDAQIKRINAELQPGNKPGESILNVLVEENQPYQIAMVVDNHRSPSVGAERLSFEGFHQNLTGRGDKISYRAGATDGLNDYAVSYEIPLNALDTKLQVRYERSDSQIIEEPFNLIDIVSESRTFGINVTHPFIKTPNEELIVGLGLDLRKSETFLEGQPFTFSNSGSENGETKVSVLRFSQQYTKRTLNQVIAARSVFSLGLDAFDATTGNGEPDGQFFSWLGQFQLARRIGTEGIQMILRADMQLSEDTLFSLEKFSVGGANSVRGFRENELVRDTGIATSIEFRIPVFKDQAGLTPFQLAPFIDAGYSRNKGGNDTTTQSLLGAGVGLHWDPDPSFHAELYLARGFTGTDDSNRAHDLQDDSIHFQMSYQLF